MNRIQLTRHRPEPSPEALVTKAYVVLQQLEGKNHWARPSNKTGYFRPLKPSLSVCPVNVWEHLSIVQKKGWERDFSLSGTRNLKAVAVGLR